ncbi:MAG: uracil-DNA glycosylase [Pyrinomonadaceae bacterium]|nr:uracil-DNA glycosylase [Pyrinomonadaceae bacterium]
MNEEINNLIADVKEELQYMYELGVETLDVGLPEKLSFTRDDGGRLPTVTPKAAGSIEKYVPDELPISPSVKKDEPPLKTRQSRKGILDETKLSKISEIPKRNQTVVPQNRREMTEKSETAAPERNLETEVSNESIEAIRNDIGNCTRCPLHAERTNIVHSKGNFQADLMFIGEAPGADEDIKAEPFVGRAGQLLTKIIEGIGLKREDVMIGNINRCRPPGNRQPTIEESAVCKPFLLREIAVVKPKVIVVMGNTATRNLLDTKLGITKLRGNFQDYFGVKVMPTFHPAYLLRDPRKKREVWEDMKMVRDELAKMN